MKLRLGTYIREQLRELARVCIDLAQAELAAFLRRLTREAQPLRGPATAVGIGLLLGFFSLAAFVTAMILGLAQVLPAWGAALVVSAVLGGAALVLLRHLRHPAWRSLRLLPPEIQSEIQPETQPETPAEHDQPD